MAYHDHSFRWRPYIPVAQRRRDAMREIGRLRKNGHEAQPVRIEGRKIAQTFWGTAWCDNLERYSDFENRLPRGRTYARNGSVIDLQIAAGKITALVRGSSIYRIEITMARAAKALWAAAKDACLGRIGSVVELLQGRLSQGVMEVLTARESGLFPAPEEIKMKCSCPDWATMCKHVAAVLYGVGNRLDSQPDLLFVLRQVDAGELISRAATTAVGAGESSATAAVAQDELASVFGIEIDADSPEPLDGGMLPPPTAAKAPRIPGPRQPTLAASRRKALQKHFRTSQTLTPGEYRLRFRVTASAARLELEELRTALLIIRKSPRSFVAGVELF